MIAASDCRWLNTFKLEITVDTDNKHKDTQALDPIIMDIFKTILPGM